MDEGPLSHHTRGNAMGRIRPARLDEETREHMLRADAVLAVIGDLPADLSAFEQYVASLIDGVRPVARIKKKANVSSTDLRIALNGLADRNVVRLAGIVEESVGVLAQDIAQMQRHQTPPPAVIILPLPPEWSAADLAGNNAAAPVAAAAAPADVALPQPSSDEGFAEPTIPGRESPIPVHVMAEIRAMLDEDEATAAPLAFDDLAEDEE